jgi:hypothetical protein
VRPCGGGAWYGGVGSSCGLLVSPPVPRHGMSTCNVCGTGVRGALLATIKLEFARISPKPPRDVALHCTAPHVTDRAADGLHASSRCIVLCGGRHIVRSDHKLCRSVDRLGDADAVNCPDRGRVVWQQPTPCRLSARGGWEEGDDRDLGNDPATKLPGQYRRGTRDHLQHGRDSPGRVPGCSPRCACHHALGCRRRRHVDGRTAKSHCSRDPSLCGWDRHVVRQPREHRHWGQPKQHLHRFIV